MRKVKFREIQSEQQQKKTHIYKRNWNHGEKMAQ